MNKTLAKVFFRTILKISGWTIQLLQLHARDNSFLGTFEQPRNLNGVTLTVKSL